MQRDLVEAQHIAYRSLEAAQAATPAHRILQTPQRAEFGAVARRIADQLEQRRLIGVLADVDPGRPVSISAMTPQVMCGRCRCIR